MCFVNHEKFGDGVAGDGEQDFVIDDLVVHTLMLNEELRKPLLIGLLLLLRLFCHKYLSPTPRFLSFFQLRYSRWVGGTEAVSAAIRSSTVEYGSILNVELRIAAETGSDWIMFVNARS